MPIIESRAHAVVGSAAAAAAGLAFAVYPLGPRAAIAAFAAAILVIIAAVDLRSLTIPNRIVLPATALVLTADIVFIPGRVPEFMLAAVLAGAALTVPNLINSSWMGMGDVKLAVLLGATLGWGVLGALEVAFLAVLPFACVLLARGGRGARRLALPFGPFMAAGTLFVLILPRLVGLGG